MPKILLTNLLTTLSRILGLHCLNYKHLNIVKQGPQMRLSNDMENKILPDILKVSAEKFENSDAYFFSEQLLEYNQNQMFRKIKVSYELLNHIGSYMVLCSVILIPEGKAGKEMPESPSSQKRF